METDRSSHPRPVLKISAATGGRQPHGRTRRLGFERMEPRWAPAGLVAWLPTIDLHEVSQPEPVQVAPERIEDAAFAPAAPPEVSSPGSSDPRPVPPGSQPLPDSRDEAAANEPRRDEEPEQPDWLDLAEISDDVVVLGVPADTDEGHRRSPTDLPAADRAAEPAGEAAVPWAGSGARPSPVVTAAGWPGAARLASERGPWRATEPVRYPLRIPAGTAAAPQPELLDLEWRPAGPPRAASPADRLASLNAAAEQTLPRLQVATQPFSSERPQARANTTGPARRVFGEHSSQPLMLIVAPESEKLPRLPRTPRLVTEPPPVAAESPAAAESEPVRPHAESQAGVPLAADDPQQAAVGITVLLLIAGERAKQHPPTDLALHRSPERAS